MTCRGSRFADGAKRNPDGNVFMKNRETDEWLKQNQKATKEFIRKWGHMVKHDEWLKPIIPSKYNIGFIVHNSNDQLLTALEPWCSNIFIDHNGMGYILNEDKQTSFDLVKKVHNIEDKKYNDILIEFDGRLVDQQNFSYIQSMSEILDNTYQEMEEGSKFELGIFKITINKIRTYEKDLIKL